MAIACHGVRLRECPGVTLHKDVTSCPVPFLLFRQEQELCKSKSGLAVGSV